MKQKKIRLLRGPYSRATATPLVPRTIITILLPIHRTTSQRHLCATIIRHAHIHTRIYTFIYIFISIKSRSRTLYKHICLGLWALGANAAAIPAQPDCGCKGTIPDSSLVKDVICGDQRLGPVDVHATRTIDLMTKAWSRLGGLCPGKWLEKWTSEDGRFVYPSDDGFQLDEKCTAVKQAAVLCPGTLVDRFGGERGSFLSPAGMPYEKRSVPPQNLVTGKEANSPLFNYHVYMVVKEMPVTAGCIAPWFDQPGLGIQYMMNGSVSAAIENGFLERVELKHDSLPKSDSRAESKCKAALLNCPGYSMGSL